MIKLKRQRTEDAVPPAFRGQVPVDRLIELMKTARDQLLAGHPIKPDDLPPDAPSFITRVCGFGFHILRRQFGQARRARSPQIAQALDARQRVFGCPAMNAV